MGRIQLQQTTPRRKQKGTVVGHHANREIKAKEVSVPAPVYQQRKLLIFSSSCLPQCCTMSTRVEGDSFILVTLGSRTDLMTHMSFDVIQQQPKLWFGTWLEQNIVAAIASRVSRRTLMSTVKNRKNIRDNYKWCIASYPTRFGKSNPKGR